MLSKSDDDAIDTVSSDQWMTKDHWLVLHSGLVE